MASFATHLDFVKETAAYKLGQLGEAEGSTLLNQLTRKKAVPTRELGAPPTRTAGSDVDGEDDAAFEDVDQHLIRRLEDKSRSLDMAHGQDDQDVHEQLVRRLAGGAQAC